MDELALEWQPFPYRSKLKPELALVPHRPWAGTFYVYRIGGYTIGAVRCLDRGKWVAYASGRNRGGSGRSLTEALERLIQWSEHDERSG